MKYGYAFGLLFLMGIVSGCVGATGSAEKSEAAAVMEKAEQKSVKTEEKASEKKYDISLSDFKRAVQTAVKNMQQSGALDNPSRKKYIVAISYVVDATKTGFDTSAIKQYLSADLAAGRKVRVVSVSSKNIVPQMVVAGRIIQRTAFVRKGKRQEYYLHLVLTEAKSGIKLWESTTPVVKRKSGQAR